MCLCVSELFWYKSNRNKTNVWIPEDKNCVYEKDNESQKKQQKCKREKMVPASDVVWELVSTTQYIIYFKSMSTIDYFLYNKCFALVQMWCTIYLWYSFFVFCFFFTHMLKYRAAAVVTSSLAYCTSSIQDKKQV